MKQQASLLNFFKKSQTTPAKDSQEIKRTDDLSTTDNFSSQDTAPILKNTSQNIPPKKVQETPLKSDQNVPPKSVQKPSKASAMQEEKPDDDDDEVILSQRLHKRLKKVRIQDDDEDEYKPEESSPSPVKKKVVSSRSIEIEEEYVPKPKTPARSAAKGKENPQSAPATDKKSAAKKSAKKTPSATPAKGGEEDDVLIDIEKNEGNAFDYNDFSDRTPEWAMKENAKDANKRKADDPNYDPTTLYIPPGALDKLTPTMKQYWTIKSQNFDKIILFKLGKFYELFYEDALVCHKELDLNWMANKMHVGFPEKALERYAFILVNRGYKVCVVEQTETPKQMEERLKKQGSGKKEKVVKREMVQVMSKGTCISTTDTDSEPKVLLAFRMKKDLISVSFLEVGANIITVGVFRDDENFTMFKTFVSQIRPVEVTYETIETHPDILKILRNCSTNPLLSPMNDPKVWGALQGFGGLEKYYKEKENWPEALKEVIKLEDSERDLIMISMAGLITYLTKNLIADNVLLTARYELYDPKKFQLSRMVLDSQALQHLEILEVGYATKSSVEGSLLHYIDKTVSPFGKRLLRKWICAPLLDINAINDRLDAIEDLERLYEQKSKFRKELATLGDIERTCARVYNQSIKKNGQQAVMFEDIAGNRLKEFRVLLDNLRKARSLLANFEDCEVKSNFLNRLITFESFDSVLERQSNCMPEITPLLDEMSKFIIWQGPNKDQPVPKPGVDQDYDALKLEIAEIEGELDDYLQTVKSKLGAGNRDVCYAHTKHRYEIEVPSSLVAKKKPVEFEFSSKKQDRERFITKYIKDQVERLEEVEEKQKNYLNTFVCFVFSYFHKHHRVWDRFIEGLAQLDCLCSLSLVSFLSDGAMCRPEVFPANERVFFEIRNMRHPCVSVNKNNFVSNDILLGDFEDNGNNKNIMLLTGPNMGGKSTILRQACIGAILAQLGCYVPADSCKLSVVDRVFTRIGASDKLFEGKSTFYIEMEETVNVLKYGTMNSLAIMDELGRGTSTFDGVSIAYSVVNYIIKRLGCRTFFATHYHVLLDEFKENPAISFYHMASRIDNEKVTFLYKLIQGECSNSFGLNIARISGIVKSVVNQAKIKADEFERNLNIREAVRVSKAFGKIIHALENNEQNEVDVRIQDIQEALESLQAE